MFDVDFTKPITHSKLRKIRKFILAESDRDVINDMLDEFSPLVAVSGEPRKGEDGVLITPLINAQLAKLASTILYDGRQHTSLMKVERLGSWAVLENMPTEELNAAITDLTRGHTEPTDAEQARYLMALREEKDIRNQHREVDGRIEEAQKKNEAVNSREAIQARIKADGDFDRLSAEQTYMMSPEDHQRHFHDLVIAARNADKDAPTLYGITERQKSEAAVIIADQQRLYDNASDLMRIQYDIKPCEYDLNKAIAAHYKAAPTKEHLEQQKRYDTQTEYVDAKRAEYNRKQLSGEKQGGFDENIIKAQFQHDNPESAEAEDKPFNFEDDPNQDPMEAQKKFEAGM